ncbi:hypothetical protein ADUPG1_006745 [Aduncisulcus paluster]|uniref:Phospholipid/glycerol acyltransferase domain-containing protein n=1 Tax=Aduncisulcus paluster TaxID=2918883 RepID=A0ABQ5KL33_9EUKA|nr:hypothetical protein ADUPG1_006745 [Aduncisulcus paluster]
MPLTYGFFRLLLISDKEFIYNPALKRHRFAMIVLQFGVRMMLFIMGVWYINIKGQPFQSACACVGPHQSWLDILILLSKGYSGFVARISVKDTIIVGAVASFGGSIFVDRRSVESRRKAGQDIKDKVLSTDKDTFLAVFPEGATNNGEQLLQFRHGIFRPGGSIQPVLLEYPYMASSPNWAAEQFIHNLLRVLASPITRANVNFLNPYVPSEEEAKSPALFAENVRKYMCSQGNLARSPLNVTHKLVFVDWLLGYAPWNHVLEKLLTAGVIDDREGYMGDNALTALGSQSDSLYMTSRSHSRSHIRSIEVGEASDAKEHADDEEEHDGCLASVSSDSAKMPPAVAARIEALKVPEPHHTSDGPIIGASVVADDDHAHTTEEKDTVADLGHSRVNSASILSMSESESVERIAERLGDSDDDDKERSKESISSPEMRKVDLKEGKVTILREERIQKKKQKKEQKELRKLLKKNAISLGSSETVPLFGTYETAPVRKQGMIMRTYDKKTLYIRYE